ncbi:MAG: PPC domain-containing protein [bacterium]|nr:PPC domain-containing protein [bacterium]MDE0352896.1 PPC domain-containing protein [bacterium]
MERVLAGRPGAHRLGRAFIALTLVASVLALPGSGAVLGQESADCEVTDLGTLGDNRLEAAGHWTTEDCDSRFRAGSDARTYRFEVTTAGRVRIELTSAGADPYLYLLAEDGTRIVGNDDGGAGLDSRVERDLLPGVYMIEATTVGGRSRGPADFAISVSYVSGCEPVHLGTLGAGADLTASGSWTLDTCGSRFVVEHPAHGYTFNLEQAGRVRIDLASEDGDPVLSLASLAGGIIGANDDGGESRNARIVRYLQAGVYFIEATTYLERDYQPLRSDFDLTVHLVDEQAEQERARLKIEEVRVPAEVVAGDPFLVEYRAGNLGGDLAPGGYAVLYVVGPRVFKRHRSVAGHWQAGVSYHSGSDAASPGSTSISEVAPFEVSFFRSGPTWVFVGVVTYDRAGNEIGFHGQWQNLFVLSGPTFEAVDVRVDGARYTVAAEADSDGEVTTEVKSATDPAAEVDAEVRLRAIYAAGVRTQLLDGLFERPEIAALPEEAHPTAVTVANLSTNTLREAFAQRYASVVGASGMIDSLEAGEALNPITIEESVLQVADAASSEFAWMASSWRSLLRRIENGAALSFEDALEAHSQVAYAESVVAAAVTAGGIVTAARTAEEGWKDPGVREMMAEARCHPGSKALRDALEAADIADLEGLVALDAEMRALRPIHGLSVDSALCGVTTAGTANQRFLRRLSISHSPELRTMLGLHTPSAPASSPAPHRLRIIARLGEDGSLEHGVELAGGRQVLPPERFLREDVPTGRWQVSGDVEVRGDSIGRIRARRVAGGRTELGFIGTDGETIIPDIRYLPTDLPVGVWFRSSEIKVPVATSMDPAPSTEESKE